MANERNAPGELRRGQRLPRTLHLQWQVAARCLLWKLFPFLSLSKSLTTVNTADTEREALVVGECESEVSLFVRVYFSPFPWRSTTKRTCNK